MLNISLPLNDLTELAVALLMVPGNFLVRIAALATAEYFSMQPDEPPFMEGGLLAVCISIFFWLALMIETFMIYRYVLTAYDAINIACHKLLGNIKKHVRRYRIGRACHDATAAPSIEDESTISYELVELDDLAMTALQIARDHDHAEGIPNAEFRKLTGANKAESSQALQQLEALQFISRGASEVAARKNYRLTSTGHMYLRASQL